MKRVYLVRHGIAAEGAGYDRDEDRPLTGEGRERLRLTVAVWLGEHEEAPRLWLVSPYVRAVQTAELCVGAFSSGARVEVSRELVPETRVSVTAALIEEQEEEVIALVAHQPLLGGLAAYLLGWPSVPAQLRPGAILAIDLPDDGPGSLAWHLSAPAADRGPRLLRPDHR